MMKSMLAIVVLMTLSLALPAPDSEANPVGCDFNIGLYQDDMGMDCDADFPLYISTRVTVLALLSPDINAITAAEFLILGVDTTPADVLISPMWSSVLVIGDALGDVGFAIAWSTPQPGPIVQIGTIDFFVLNEDWPGQDVLWCVGKTNDSNKRIVVDENFVEHDIGGCCFTANCSDMYCDCLPSTPVYEASWSDIRSLY